MESEQDSALYAIMADECTDIEQFTIIIRWVGEEFIDQLLGQLPAERVSPAAPFERTGVDYAGPLQIKYGHVRKPTIVKTYMSSLYASLSKLCTYHRGINCIFSSLHCETWMSQTNVE